MNRDEPTGELFPDNNAIQAGLERRTRDALLRRLGPQTSPASDRVVMPPDVSVADSGGARERARGIGFAVDLVRAILDGRKTQTRRPVRPQPVASAVPPPVEACSIARVGEVLYVREPWVRVTDQTGVRTHYAADGTDPAARRFRPGMYMPRDAARLWLRVTDVRAERLQAITPHDLTAEGLPPGQTFADVWGTFYKIDGVRYVDNPWVWVIAFTVIAS